VEVYVVKESGCVSTGPVINMEIRNNTFANSNVSKQNNNKTKIDDNYET